MQAPTEEDPARLRADLLVALVLVVLGLGIVYMSWTMNRLEVRHIHPATIPGLVPLILGAMLTLCAGILAWRTARQQAPGGWAALRAMVVSPPAIRALVVLALALVYTLGLVGRMPFWLASAIFIFVFIMLFETVLAEERKPVLRSLFWATAVAVVGAGGVYVVFERIFLVRLP